jgi:hypothetical protein
LAPRFVKNRSVNITNGLFYLDKTGKLNRGWKKQTFSKRKEKRREADREKREFSLFLFVPTASS